MRSDAEPKWLTAVQMRILHGESIRLFGGRSGLRDEHLLESALARPRQVYVYGDNADLATLAAEYAFGLARDHPFIDGNKRVALLAARAFLYVNGFGLKPDQVETVTIFERLAAGELDQSELAEWLRKNARPR